MSSDALTPESKDVGGAYFSAPSLFRSIKQTVAASMSRGPASLHSSMPSSPLLSSPQHQHPPAAAPSIQALTNDMQYEAPEDLADVWPTVREQIREFRRSQPPCIALLKDFCFDPARSRCLFLGVDSPAGIKTTSLFSISYGNLDSFGSPSELEWRPIVDPSWTFKPEPLSQEEQLQRERMRQAGSGFSNYLLLPNHNQLLLVLGGAMFIADATHPLPAKPQPLFPADSVVRMDPKASSVNGRTFISYIRSRDIWVVDLATGVEWRLTRSSEAAGEADQEEDATEEASDISDMAIAERRDSSGSAKRLASDMAPDATSGDDANAWDAVDAGTGASSAFRISTPTWSNVGGEENTSMWSGVSPVLSALKGAALSLAGAPPAQPSSPSSGAHSSWRPSSPPTWSPAPTTWSSAPSSRSARASGVAEFIMQEEFHRFTGYWWAPDGSSRILHVAIDESDVHVANLGGGEGVDEFRYPLTSTANAASDVRIVSFDTSFVRAPVVRRLRGARALQRRFPWAEYVPRLAWTDDARAVVVQLLDRRQQRTALVLVHVDEFMSDEEARHQQDDDEDLTSGPHEAVLVEEHVESTWINVTDILHFLPCSCGGAGQGGCARFVWSSERTGYRHLYLVERCTSDLRGQTHIVALTSGEWAVADEAVSVDVARGRVYFAAARDTPLETHYYMTTLEGAEPVRLTELGYSHSVTFSESFDMLVDTFSSLESPPRTIIARLSADPCVHIVGDIRRPLSLAPLLPTPRRISFPSRTGELLHGLVYAPARAHGSSRLPVLLKVYGGPHAQFVTNDYKFPRFLQLFLAVHLGHVVVLLDGRGSCGRGVAFESHLRHRMGTVELEDQVDALQFVARELGGMVDLDRVAITGWSYGGYLSLMAMARHSDVFRLAVAGAPVVQWELYDTAYTERYMGLPSDNPEGYRNGSILSHIADFPQEENRVLVVHGLIDENVHYENTRRFAERMAQEGRPCRVQVYPNERHGIRHPNTFEHYETLLFSYLRKYL